MAVAFRTDVNNINEVRQSLRQIRKSLGTTSGSTTDHNTLQNLTVGDPHTQYAYLLGRLNGQTLIGGTNANDNLTLRSTASATRGLILHDDPGSMPELQLRGAANPLRILPDPSSNAYGVEYPQAIGAIGDGLIIQSITSGVAKFSWTPGGGSGEINTASNIGAGTGLIFKQKVGSNLELRTLTTSNRGEFNITTPGDEIIFELVVANIEHGDLDPTSLGTDDHLQYALLAGRGAGQTLRGGANASTNLVLESTSSGTKGIVQSLDPFRAPVVQLQDDAAGILSIDAADATANYTIKLPDALPADTTKFLGVSGVGGGVVDTAWVDNPVSGLSHSALSDLVAPADDHTQYALLSGRNLGQTLAGGTIAGQNLILQSNSAAPSGGFVTLASRLNGLEIRGTDFRWKGSTSGNIRISPPSSVVVDYDVLLPAYDAGAIAGWVMAIQSINTGSTPPEIILEWANPSAGGPPTAHATTHQSGGTDTVDHDLLVNAIGLANDHAAIDTHIADGGIHYLQSAIDHGTIGGLSDDDHSQYALLAGRAGGQQLTGSNVAAQNLTLRSNSADPATGFVQIASVLNTDGNLIVGGTVAGDDLTLRGSTDGGDAGNVVVNGSEFICGSMAATSWNLRGLISGRVEILPEDFLSPATYTMQLPGTTNISLNRHLAITAISDSGAPDFFPYLTLDWVDPGGTGTEVLTQMWPDSITGGFATGYTFLQDSQGGNTPIITGFTADADEDIDISFIVDPGYGVNWIPIVTIDYVNEAGTPSQIQANLVQVDPDIHKFRGSATIKLSTNHVISLQSDDLGVFNINYTQSAAPPNVTGVIWDGVYPLYEGFSQTAVRSGQDLTYAVTIDAPADEIEVLDFELGNGQIFSGPFTADTHNLTMQASPVSARRTTWVARNAAGSPGTNFTVQNAGSPFVDQASPNVPNIGQGSIAYPAGQEAIKTGESATATVSISSFTAVNGEPAGNPHRIEYTALNSDTTAPADKAGPGLANPDVSSWDWNAGSYRVSGTNVRLRAVKTSNGTTDQDDFLIQVANTPSVLTLTGLDRARSSPTGQNEVFTMSFNQEMLEAEIRRALGDNSANGTLTPSGSPPDQTWNVTLTQDDQGADGNPALADNKGTFTFRNGANGRYGRNLALVPTVTAPASDDYTLGGFTSRNVSRTANEFDPNPPITGFRRMWSFGCAAEDVTKVTAIRIGPGALNRQSFTPGTDVSATQVALGFTVVDANALYDPNGEYFLWLDITQSNLNIAETFTLEETL